MKIRKKMKMKMGDFQDPGSCLNSLNMCIPWFGESVAKFLCSSKCQDTLVASLGADEMRAMHLTDVPWPPWAFSIVC